MNSKRKKGLKYNLRKIESYTRHFGSIMKIENYNKGPQTFLIWKISPKQPNSY